MYMFQITGKHDRPQNSMENRCRSSKWSIQMSLTDRVYFHRLATIFQFSDQGQRYASENFSMINTADKWILAPA
jgi:hypothetical protein